MPYGALYDITWEDGAGEKHKIERNGCMPCGTDLLYPNNHLSALRHTHPHVWETFMRAGLADEIIKLQRAKRGGQYSVFDFIGDADYLIENRPCAFDRIDQVVLGEAQREELLEYDPEE